MFKTIGLFGKYQDHSIKQPLRKLAQHLDKKSIQVKIGHTTVDGIIEDLPSTKLSTKTNNEIDLAIVIGGDGTQAIGYRLMTEYNIPVIGVPKTIDNDLGATDFTFGFWSAVDVTDFSCEKKSPLPPM